jgi:hypothetical protein
MALIRRLSSRSRSKSGVPETPRDSVRGPKPPISGGGGFFRSLSRRGSTSGEQQPPPRKLTRTMSLGRADEPRQDEPKKPGFFDSLRRKVSQRRPDDGGINGQWGAESEGDDDDYYYNDPRAYGDPRMQGQGQGQGHQQQPSGLRGGGVEDEYSDGDEEYFSARPPARTQTVGSVPTKEADGGFPPTRPFHRTPTGLSTKQMRQAENYAVDLEGGLDICLNVEVNPKDPTGITVPYRLLVPKLFYEYNPGEDDMSTGGVERKSTSGGGFRKLLSFRKKERGYVRDEDDVDGDEDDDGHWDDRR